MNKRINFEDNIFILLMRIKLIKDTITLDGDPEIFLEKILDDFYFIGHVLGLMLEYMQENDKLISREELLINLSDTERQYNELIYGFLNHRGDLSVNNIPEVSEKLQILEKSSLERQKIIDKLCTNDRKVKSNHDVSSDEITELLKAF